MSNLVIVESPAKAKTINKYLGSNFKVTASFGHVRDLPKSKTGIDVEKDFEPTYITIQKSKKVVGALKKMAKDSDEIYLATDLDREGEAISWHIAQALGLKNKDPKVKRIVFAEITKEAVKNAIKNPREIDMDLVDAQQARRVIDRLVGYNLSPLLWKKVMKGLSAGRVQSVAVRLIVEREREIESFKSEEYWQVEADLAKDKKTFTAKLIACDGKRLDKLEIKNEKEAEKIEQKLKDGKYKVSKVEQKEEKKYPYAPFTTSTMQQEAGNRLGFSARQTMRLAQSLYEAGHITYMRTDSVNLSSQAVGEARRMIESEFGKEYLPSSPKTYKSKARLTQEAHEAIRPTDFTKRADQLSGFDPKSQKLYDLIWKRTVASQMKEATIGITDVKIECLNYTFATRGQMIKFYGFLKIYPDKVVQTQLPDLSVEDILDLIKLSKSQHFTQPPARYSEATLIKALEEKGIGRPSTYAPTISTIQDRGYIEKEQGRLKPVKIGFVVNDLLVKNFSDIVDYEFTAKIEGDLDKIAAGDMKWQEPIRRFYEPFIKNLNEKTESIESEKANLSEELEEKCPDCGKNLVVKHSRNGKFIGCSGFPDCRYTRSFVSEKVQAKIDQGEKQIDGKKCPKCGAKLKVVNGKFGPFIGCSKYPDCKYMEKISIDR
jgi:DNA topoisomerase-1